MLIEHATLLSLNDRERELLFKTLIDARKFVEDEADVRQAAIPSPYTRAPGKMLVKIEELIALLNGKGIQ